MEETEEINRETMSKKTLSIILGIIALVVVVGAVLFAQRGKLPGKTLAPGAEEGSPELSPKEAAAQEAAEIDAIVREAINTQDPIHCERIENEEKKNWCKDNAIIAEAMVKLDPNICEKLGNEDTILVCRDSVIVNRAVVNKNPDLCDTLRDKTRVEPCKRDASSQ